MEKKDNLLIKTFMSTQDDIFIIDEKNDVSYNESKVDEAFTKIGSMGHEIVTMDDLSGVYNSNKGLNVTNRGDYHELKTIIDFINWYNG